MHENINWFSERLSQLRAEKGVSARDMSLSLGQSESYINKIENQRTMPSMSGFFYICDYFRISPSDFFDTLTASPLLLKELQAELQKLSPEEIQHIITIIKDIAKNKK